MADTYAGSGWLQQQLQAIIESAMANLNLAELLGWWTEGAEEARPEPTENEALDAIWAARPDIKVFYDENWGADKYDPREAVRNWLYISGEGKDKSPVQYAIEKGLVKPASAGTEGTKTPTLAREQWEAAQKGSEADRAFAREQWEASEKRAKESLGLSYMNLLSGLTGPRDYFKYQQIKRGAEGSELPAWAAALASGRALAPYEGVTGTFEPLRTGEDLLTPATTTWIDKLYEAATPATTAPATATPATTAPATTAPATATLTPSAAWITNPHLVRPDQWAALMPSERETLAGAIEYMGGDFDDWYEQMKKAAPTGTALAGTTFSGW